MKKLILTLATVCSLLTMPVFASVNPVMTADQQTAQQISDLQQEVQILRQIIMNSRHANVSPQCLVTGERCSSAYDVCCNSGRYCGNAGGICP